MKFAGWFGIVVGIGMMGMWTVFLLTGQVPEINSEPYRIAFHLAAEFITAIGLLAAGIAILKDLRKSPSLYLAADGMLLYTLIVSPGYYAQLGDWGFVIMFGILFVLALVSFGIVLRNKKV